jgi:hypothetical protein
MLDTLSDPKALRRQTEPADTADAPSDQHVKGNTGRADLVANPESRRPLAAGQEIAHSLGSHGVTNPQVGVNLLAHLH